MVFIVRKNNLWGAYDIYGDELIACNKESVASFQRSISKPTVFGL